MKNKLPDRGTGPAKLAKSQFQHLIPHKGRMSLIDSVEYWDQSTIRCLSASYRDPLNPFCADGNLSSIHLLEYGAQAMAIHGGLLNNSATLGVLAAFRNIQLYIENTGDLTQALRINAVANGTTDRAAIYTISISDHLQAVLVAAQATVADRRILTDFAPLKNP